MKSVEVGLIGAGTIGCGVYRTISENADIIEKRTGVRVRIKKVADIDIKRKRPVKIPRRLFTTDALELINDENISIIIELIGGTSTARELVLAAIRSKKHIVTANKALLAHHGREIFMEAAANGVHVAFEASVGGGIPIIKATHESYVANNILSIHGIMNGTCNYILHNMSEQKKEFDEMLRCAQKEGYAEANPSFDIEGIDAAHKLSILIMLSYGFFPEFDDIHVEGIRNISSVDISFAEALGYRIKLLAIAKSTDAGIQAGVYPALIRKNTQLADVKDAFNAIHIVGDKVGPTMLYGMGAGMLPTASAVVGDLVSIAKTVQNGLHFASPMLYAEEDTCGSLVGTERLSGRYYLRFQVEDKPGTLGEITTILGKYAISIESILQQTRETDGGEVPIIIMTHESQEKSLREALGKIKKSMTSVADAIFIRIEEV
ncbi:MAG: homoserine dehydrogenase [Candidatus Dadabacteria bacterium]|nr:homoserine dehydrogenase [Candidatus Dadabacteria bacterium]